LAAGAGLLLLLAWGGWTYFEAKAEAERLQRDSDPNLIYEQSYSNSIASLTSMGDPGLRNMINTIKNIPLEVRGWRLSQVACQPAECIVTWARLSGNYADFDENMPSDVKVRPEYGYLSSDAGAVQLKTRHPVVTSESTVVTPASAGSGVSPASSFTREKLPVARQVQSEFVSRLQDYQLIAARVQVSVPAPFPAGVTDIGPIFKPVIYGTWSMELPMWSIETISVPDYVLVDSLSLVLPEKKDADKSQLQYKISGKYYAKGKEY
jgi:hypothetical protein